MTLAGKVCLVTGATGFLGGAITKALSQQGAQVRALARRPNRDAYIRDLPNVTIVEGDVTDAGRMETLIAGCDVVFHVAVAFANDMEKQRLVNVEGTRHVMDAAGKASVQRVVNISSIAIYGFKHSGRIDEDTPRSINKQPYAVTKYEAEQVVAERANHHGIEYSIVRPGMIYGPRSGQWTDAMFKLVRRKPIWFVGDGRGTAPTIYVDDVVDLTLTCATHPQATGEAFNCVNDPAPTWREFLTAYGRLAGNELWIGVPTFLVRALAMPVDAVMNLRGKPIDAGIAIRFVEQPLRYAMDKAKTRLDWQPKTMLAEGIEKCIPYLQEKGWLD